MTDARLLSPLLAAALLLAGCDAARPDPTVPAISVSAGGATGNALTDQDLGIHKAALSVQVPDGDVLVVTTLVFRNRSLDRTLSTETFRMFAPSAAASVPLSALVFDPHGPLRPQSDDWLLSAPGLAAVSVHDSPNLSVQAIDPGRPTVLGATQLVLIAIDPDGAASVPPGRSDLLHAHIAAAVFVRVAAASSTDPALAPLAHAGALGKHEPFVLSQPLSQNDDAYLGLLPAH